MKCEGEKLPRRAYTTVLEALGYLKRTNPTNNHHEPYGIAECHSVGLANTSTAILGQH
jgi:hypothetical protein